MSKRSARNSRAAAPSSSGYGGGGRGVPAKTGGHTTVAEGLKGGGGIKSLVLWLSALVLITSGYALLHKADPGGQNIWAIVSPALLLCGYLLIIPAIACTYPKK